MKSLSLLLFITQLVACGDPAAKAGGATEPAAKSCIGCAKGNEQGNGSDYIHYDEGSAWFLNETRTIRYCLQMSPNFGVDEAFAEDTVKTALKRWSAYVKAKHIFAKVTPPRGKLAVRSENIGACDGSEDLAFYFGVQAARNQNYLGQTAGRVAAAVRTDYDSFTGWGKGFIWVTPRASIEPDYSFNNPSNYPDWSLGQNLLRILTHELGHVYGTGHVSDTIMRADIANNLQMRAGQLPWEGSDQIDDKQELVVCKDCHYDYRGSLGVRAEVAGGQVLDTAADTYKLLTGHAAAVASDKLRGRIAGDPTSGFTFEVTDGDRTQTLPIKFEMSREAYFIGSTDVFRLVVSARLSEAMTSTTRTYEPHIGYAVPGHLVTADGETLELTLQRNLTSYTPGPANEAMPFIPVEIQQALTIMYVYHGISRPLLIVPASEMNL